MESLILGADPGNNGGKFVGSYGALHFRSNICEYFEMEKKESFGPDDTEWEIDGRRGYGGSIALVEDEFASSMDGVGMYGDSKAHEDAKIRILLGIYLYMKKFNVDAKNIYMVTGQPIVTHTEDEKKKIKHMLLGSHQYTVNGDKVDIEIKGLEIAPEGSAAIWGNPQNGVIRIIDVGSGTVNLATLLDKRHVNKDSETLRFGVDTTRNKDLGAMARGIIRNTSKKWGKHDKVLVCGGKAEEIFDEIQKQYENAEILKPTFRTATSAKVLHPVFANAVGNYELAKGRFANEI